MLAVLQRKSDILAPDLSNYGKARPLTYPIRVNTPSVDQMYKKESSFMSMTIKEIDEEQIRLYKMYKKIIDKYF